MSVRMAGVLAQTVDVTPDAAGMPGGALIQQLLNWSQMLALWGSLGAILIGAAKPAHILTPAVTARGIMNMTAFAVVEAQAAAHTP